MYLQYCSARTLLDFYRLMFPSISESRFCQFYLTSVFTDIKYSTFKACSPWNESMCSLLSSAAAWMRPRETSVWLKALAALTGSLSFILTHTLWHSYRCSAGGYFHLPCLKGTGHVPFVLKSALNLSHEATWFIWELKRYDVSGGVRQGKMLVLKFRVSVRSAIWPCLKKERNVLQTK